VNAAGFVMLFFVNQENFSLHLSTHFIGDLMDQIFTALLIRFATAQ